MNSQAPTEAAVEQRYARRGNAAIERLPDAPSTLHRGRFSSGHEQRPNAPDKLRLGRYSQGIEQLPDAPGKLRVGRFSSGIEQAPEQVVGRRHGNRRYQHR